MVARSASPGAYTPVEPPQVSVAGDGTLAAVYEASRITIVELPGAAAFAEVGVDPEAHGSDVAWVGSPPRLLVLSRYATGSTVHLLDPLGPRTIAEIRLESPMRLVATVGASALIIGAQAAMLAATETHLTLYPIASRNVPLAAGAAAGYFVVAFTGTIEEWDPQTRAPRRRLRLPRAASITAVGGSDRIVWMTTQQEPARIEVVPLVNRGQPRVHELPEPIARIAGHPRSDLVACIGARSGRLYVVDLDGRVRLRAIGTEGIDRIASAGLIMGRVMSVLAVQEQQPLAVVHLDGREVELEIARAVLPAADGAEAAVPAELAADPPATGESQPIAAVPPEPASSLWERPSQPGIGLPVERASATWERPSQPGIALPDAALDPLLQVSLPGARSAPILPLPVATPVAPGAPRVPTPVAPLPARPTGMRITDRTAPAPGAPAPPAASAAERLSAWRDQLRQHAAPAEEAEAAAQAESAAMPPAALLPRSEVVPAAMPRAELAGSAAQRAWGAVVAPAAPPLRADAAGAAPTPAHLPQGEAVLPRDPPTTPPRAEAWGATPTPAQLARAAVGAPAGTPTPPPRGDAAGASSPPAPLPRIEVVASAAPPTRLVPLEASSAWRDDVVAWCRALGSVEPEPEPPDAPAIDAVLARFDLASALRPVLAFLYGAHLCGQRGVAPVDVAQLLGRDWTEALGRGELAARGVAEYVASRVALAPAVLRVLDELPPTTGSLVGEPGSVALIGPCVLVSEAPLAELARRHCSHVGGAILVGRDDADPAVMAVEARAYGAVAMLRAGAGLSAPPTEPAIYVVADAALAERLSLPRLE